MYSIVAKHLVKFAHKELLSNNVVLLENISSKVGHLVNKCRDFMDPESLFPCPSKPVLRFHPYTYNPD
jgi:hypothetical protein